MEGTVGLAVVIAIALNSHLEQPWPLAYQKQNKVFIYYKLQKQPLFYRMGPRFCHCFCRFPRQITSPGHAGHNVYRAVPKDCWNHTIVR